MLLLFPSSDEPRQPLPIKVSRSLEQALEKLNLSSKAETLESSCTGRDELMDGTGVAYGKFSVGCFMAGSVQSVSAVCSATCKPANLHLGGTLGWSVLSWGAGRGQGEDLGAGMAVFFLGEVVLLSQVRRLPR